MSLSSRAVPTIFDYIELRLRLRVKRSDDPFMSSAGVTLPIARVM